MPSEKVFCVACYAEQADELSFLSTRDVPEARYVVDGHWLCGKHAAEVWDIISVPYHLMEVNDR